MWSSFIFLLCFVDQILPFYNESLTKNFYGNNQELMSKNNRNYNTNNKFIDVFKAEDYYEMTTLLGTPASDKVSTTSSPKVTFRQENNTHTRAQVGSTVVLHCPAQNVGNDTVTWIRHRDYHLLTVGLTAYSSDMRYQVRYIKKEKDWQLHIRYLQKRDEGVYECQVSSHPPVSLMTELSVVEAKSQILGGPEKYLRKGSSLRLVCVLRKTTHPPAYVFWYLNNRMINYDPEMKVETSDDISVLFLSNLGPESSGNYSCVPSNAKPSTIHIQILRGGEIPAAIHSSASPLVLCEKNQKMCFVASVLVVIFSFVDFTFFYEIFLSRKRVIQNTGGVFRLFKKYSFS